LTSDNQTYLTSSEIEAVIKSLPTKKLKKKKKSGPDGFNSEFYDFQRTVKFNIPQIIPQKQKEHHRINFTRLQLP
jgi:hypothetical protein